MDPSELMIPDARGGRRASGPLVVEVVRSLEPGDIPTLLAGVKGPGAPTVQQLRYNHHRLAQALAAGASYHEAGLLTGYAYGTVARLASSDPAFRELVAHYRDVKALVFVDAMERLKALGLTALEELQQQMDERPESFTIQQKMEVVEMALVKTRQGQGASSGPGAGGGGAGVSVNINFVKPEPGVVISGEASNG